MFRTVLASAVLLSSSAFAPIAAHAAPATAYYTATPAAAPSRPTFIASDTVWKWTDTAYTAAQGPQREAIVCETVARRAGKLTTFTAGGTTFDAAALEKCNARAK